jgi:hypothetical protein
MADTFSYKFVAENKPLSFDFSQVLTVGETLSTSSCSVIVIDGTDSNPSNLLAGGSSINANKVYQQVQNGVAGVTYRIVATVTTSAGNTLIALGDLPVYSPDEVQ